MLTIKFGSWRSKLATFFVWLALGLCLAFWWLRAQVTGVIEVPPVASIRTSLDAHPGRVAAVLGGAIERAAGAEPTAIAVGAETRLALVGVVADGRGGGAALLAIDGQPPKPYRTGASVLDGLNLTRIDRKSVWIGPAKNGAEASSGSPAFEIKLPSVESRLTALPANPSAGVVANANTPGAIVPRLGATAPVVSPMAERLGRREVEGSLSPGANDVNVSFPSGLTRMGAAEGAFAAGAASPVVPQNGGDPSAKANIPKLMGGIVPPSLPSAPAN
jgi:general secretion pathway protein C